VDDRTFNSRREDGPPAVSHTFPLREPEAGPPPREPPEPTLPPDAAPPVDDAGRPEVPGYEVLGELGRGGMGVVYKARDTRLGRLVALKMVLHADHAGAAERDRFRREARAVASLQHPHIVQVYETGEADGCPFLSLEFCANGSLAARLDGTPWPAARAAELVETLARAVHAAHRAGVVHRDLKPANVLLTADDTPKLTDFGLAKRLDAERGQTRTGAVLGTPSYMAPEQASGGGATAGPAADVYALGAILYELLAGRPPFKAATPLETVLQVVGDDPVPPSRLQRRLPRDLETVCLKCLDKSPARRYGSAEALADDLRRFQAGEPVRARPARLWERGVKWARRRPAAAALLAVSLLAVASLLGLGLAYQARLRESNVQLADALDRATLATARAESEHNRAQAHLHRALDAVDRLYHKFGDTQLANLPQFAGLREQLLQEALELHRGLLREESQDPAVRREAGRSFTRVAGLYLLAGESAKAEEACREARRLQEGLVADFPDKPEYRHDLGRTHSAFGHVCSTRSRFDEALRAYREALAVSTRLARQYPDNPDYQSSLARDHNSLGYFHSFADPQQAEGDFRRAVAAAERVAAAHPAKDEYACLLAGSYSNLAMALGRQGNWQETEAVLGRALALLQPAGRPAPQGAAEYRPVLAMTQLLRGQVYAQTGRPRLSEEPLREARSAFEQLVQSQPRHFAYRNYLAGTYQAQAEVYLGLDRSGPAEEAWGKAIATFERMAADYPSFPWLAPLADRLRARRLALLAQKGEPAKLLSNAEALAGKQDLPGDVCYNLACVYAQAAAAASEAAAEGHARHAVALLVRAEQAGYFRIPSTVAHLKEDEDLRALRPRDDFRSLVARLESQHRLSPPGPTLQ
jgi:tetratricopeptide (TPR) repeat protein/tRNA A-37 threonylcarbamoyl transferase component Bud32